MDGYAGLEIPADCVPSADFDRERPAPCAKSRLRGSEAWRLNEDGSYHLTDRVIPPWQTCVHDHRDQIEKLPEYARAVAALESDPEIAPQLGVFVGTVLGGSTVTARQLAMRVLTGTAYRGSGLRFNEDAFSAAFGETEAFWRNDSVAVSAFAPLAGFTVGNPPIHFDDDLFIDHLTDEEVSVAIGMGAMRPFFGSHRWTRPIAPVCALRCRVSVPKLRPGEDDDNSLEEASKLSGRVSERLASAIQALRLFKEGTFRAPMVMTNLAMGTGDTSYTGQALSSEGADHFGPGYSLRAEDETLVRDLWRNLQVHETKKWLDTALRRFGYAQARGRSDDKITDLMIAAESMFMNDMDHAVRGELKFRLAVRAALFIDGTEFTRREVLRFFQQAYDLRSKLVHGGIPDFESLKSPKGTPFTLHEYVGLVERLIRRALRKAAETKRPDWNALLFPDLNDGTAATGG